MDILIDIETLPNLATREESIAILARAARKSKYPNSKPETLDKWVADPKNKDAVQDTWRRTGLDRLQMRILTIAVDIPDQEDAKLVVSAPYPTRAALLEVSEGVATQTLNECEMQLLHTLDDYFFRQGVYEGHVRPRFLTWNGASFDLPSMWLRSIKYGNSRLGKNLPSGKFDKRSFDLAEIWKGTDFKGRMNKMQDVVRWLGGEPQTGIMGAQVYEAWADGRIDEIEAHCNHDIDDLAFIYNCLHAAGGVY